MINYTVVSGDTLWGIANKYGMTVNELKSINNLTSDTISIGQVLKVKAPAGSGGSSGGSSTSYINYTVVSGDTLWGIANKYGMTVNELKSINNLTSDTISIGQVLKVKAPAGSGGSSGGSSIDTPTGSYIVTKAQFDRLGWVNVTDKVLNDCNNCLKRYNITTSQRIRHFIAQCSVESGAGKWTKELSDGTQYEGRKDLGNVYPGDGPKYKGAGYIQLTGRYNYQKFCDYMGDKSIMDGVNYVSSTYPWTSAGFWWMNNNMNAFIDNGATCDQVSRKVNGGDRGINERRQYYNLCCSIF